MKKKVYQNIEDSEYSIKMLGYTFFFSSYYCRTKFCGMIDEYIKNMNAKFKGMYGIKVDTTNMCIFKAYSLCEKRGTRIYNDEGTRVWPEQIELIIEKKI